jgi:hypothetical protein
MSFSPKSYVINLSSLSITLPILASVGVIEETLSDLRVSLFTILFSTGLGLDSPSCLVLTTPPTPPILRYTPAASGFVNFTSVI